MRDGGRRARVAAPALEPLPSGEFHAICGKFCVQMTSGTRKALLGQALRVIEPKRSNPRNRFNKKSLIHQWRQGNRQSPDRPVEIKFTAISTVGGN
jgi:hypothetical protein